MSARRDEQDETKQFGYPKLDPVIERAIARIVNAAVRNHVARLEERLGRWLDERVPDLVRLEVDRLFPIDGSDGPIDPTVPAQDQA